MPSVLNSYSFNMSKQFRARCLEMEGGISPDVLEIYNVNNPSETYLAGTNQFRSGQYLTEDEFYLESYMYGDEEWLIAFRK